MSGRSDSAPTSLGERYDILGELGRGGMATVYRAFDRVRKREVALKQLIATAEAPVRASVAALFEREFQTLAELRHPNVIEVYDYGVPGAAAERGRSSPGETLPPKAESGSNTGPYYTMELLDGGDLFDRGTAPWRDACSIMFDVCSSLALLHSRGLLHRDISPRNIHCTLSGKAKLIDFGAMGPMSPGGAQVVGTPAFCAPETLHKLALDARTDLFSLGVTLYYTLTERLPYPGRTFADMLIAWTTKVVPPSVIKPGLPAALDDLVLALIHPEPELRPASAHDVMQRLAAIAGLRAAEAETVQSAYLITPMLVGRADLLDELRKKLMSARLQRGSGALIRGVSGIGRSRLLDACALEAKTFGFYVLRASCSGSGEVFGVAQALIQHLLQAWPNAANTPDAAALIAQSGSDGTPVFKPLSGSDPTQVQRAFCQLLLRASRARPLLLCVDDIHRIDPPSAAVLASLLDNVEAHLFVALTCDSSAEDNDAINALSRRCQLLEPAPLTHAQTQQLLGSVFGDVPHLANLNEEIFRLALGNPRTSIDLARDLVDRGVLRYEAGTWLLPDKLSEHELPRTSAEALQIRVDRLSPTARWLAQAQALAYFETLCHEDFLQLRPELTSAQVEHALSELLRAQVLVQDGQRYSLANRVLSAALAERLSPTERTELQRALMQLYQGKFSTAEVHHAFCAGLDEHGLDRLLQRQAALDKSFDPKVLVEEAVPKMIWAYEPAIATAVKLGRSAKEVNGLRRWWMAGLITNEFGGYTESNRLWFEQLAHDSGLKLYLEDTQSKPEERLTKALTAAYQRFMATPEAERVYPVDEAIRLLAEYVVYCIALGGRAGDVPLLCETRGILEPFAALSPVLDAIYNNAVATYESAYLADYDSAHTRWRGVLAKLDAMSGAELQMIEPIRNAVVYGLAMSELQLGLKSVTQLAARLDSDPYQSVAALTLRKVERLQQGDYRGAEQYRRRAELLALELRWPQMFKSTLFIEAWTYTRIGDLAGLRDVIEQLRRLAEHFPGWAPVAACGDASFHQVRGDFETARAKYEACAALSKPDDQGIWPVSLWLAAQAGMAESLFELGRFQEAEAAASCGLKYCEERQLKSAATDLVRTAALAESKLGHNERAVALLDALIAEQRELGSTGLRIGLSYEARAFVALRMNDAQGFEQFAQLTAQEYRHGARSPLGARYERLLNEAKRVGFDALGGALPELLTHTVLSGLGLATQDLLTLVARSMTSASKSNQRANAALELVCGSRNASAGHLYLCAGSALVLSASRGEPPDAELVAAAQHFLDAKTKHAEAISDMITGEPGEDLEAVTVESQGVSYELLLLSCVTEGANTPVAVAAVSVTDAATDRAKEAQLLQALATHLLRETTKLR
ncbi:MAG TPA: serine/threonine-protein kinase [Polyangiales bacterium]|nr:serine/threonine-protein kinase [Polyangiales bacterium]